MITSYDLNERTTVAVRELQKPFGVASNAEVISKAIALAQIASKLADEHGKIQIVREGKAPLTVALIG